MPRTYSDEAIEECFRLYLKFNGQQHDRVQSEMRKRWPGWSKQNLYTRGRGRNQKLGWIEKFGWERALKEKIALAQTAQAATAEQALFIELEQIRKKLHEKIHVKGSTDRDVIYQHLAYSRLSVTALAKLKGAGLTFDSFVAFWERLLDWLPELSDEAAAALLAVADEVLERARTEYGEQEEAAGRE